MNLVNTSNEPTQSNYSPILMAAANIILFGVPYLIMHLYKRFFVVFGIMAAVLLSNYFLLTGFIDSPVGMVATNLFNSMIYPFFVFVIVDTFLQAKKINTGKLKPGKMSMMSTVFGVIALLVFGILYILISEDIQLTLRSKQSNAWLGQMQVESKNYAMDRRDKILAEYAPPLLDEQCDSLGKKEIFSGAYSNYAPKFVEYCYFIKAIEKSDVRYCRDSDKTYAYNDECVAMVAKKLDEPAVCYGLATYPDICRVNAIKGFITTWDGPCEIDAPGPIKQLCEQEFKGVDVYNGNK
ncbi:MAG: hypothetical protein A2538_03270 [Candidatus Magasanikbacteria bacterium RIFOXYD2_FULL_41_14]|uniref:Uncharacterized protein n=1 Tax=Candidatus Magasanikbacteria bacterium RIFOXYD2_FULL_41_14 TaxID=1798709 RepID=A0A1F6PCG7_9BACT|nr:MAG: hypothetical protein A2538_03270 [Candidatus Magasanikbacteria bacterium RIFOXYD2_FULL_41_14]